MFAEGKNKELLKICLDEAESKVITRSTKMTNDEKDEMFRLRSMNLDYYDEHLKTRLRELESKWDLESYIQNERKTVVQAYAQALYNERVVKVDKRTFTEDEVRNILKDILSSKIEESEVIEIFRKYGIE